MLWKETLGCIDHNIIISLNIGKLLCLYLLSSSPNGSSISEDIGVVRNGDVVEVVHLLSSKLLNR